MSNFLKWYWNELKECAVVTGKVTFFWINMIVILSIVLNVLGAFK